MTLRTRFLRALLLVALPPALLAVPVFGLVLRSSLERSAAIEMREEVGRSGRRLESGIDRAIDRLLLLSREKQVVDEATGAANEIAGSSPATVRAMLKDGNRDWAEPGSALEREILGLPLSVRFLREVGAGKKEITQLFLTDRTGRLIAASARDEDYDQSDEDWWKTAWDGGRGAVYVGGIEFETTGGTLAIAAPVRSEAGAVCGVLRGLVGVRQFLEEGAEVAEGSGAGLTLYSRTGAGVHVGPGTAPSIQALLGCLVDGESGTAVLEDEEEGAPVTAAYQPLHIGDRDGVRRAEEESYFLAAHRAKSPFTSTWTLLALLVASELLVLGGVGAAAWRIARHLEADLRGLETALGAAAKGRKTPLSTPQTGALESVAKAVEGLQESTRASLDKSERLTVHLRRILRKREPSADASGSDPRDEEDRRSRLLAGFSEEVRAYRAAVHSLVDMLSLYRESPTTHGGLLRIAETETRRLNDLLGDMLELCRLEEPPLPLAPSLPVVPPVEEPPPPPGPEARAEGVETSA